MGNGNSCQHENQRNPNKHKSNTKTHIPQKYIKKLNNTKFKDLNIKQLIYKAKKNHKISKPLVIIVSPATNNTMQRNYVITVNYKTHKDIRTGIEDQIKLKFKPNKYKHDGLVIKLLCIISTCTSDAKQLQFYYDLHQEPRHISILRKTIKLELRHIPVIIDSGSCPVFNPNVKNSPPRTKFRAIHTNRTCHSNRNVVTRHFINQASKNIKITNDTYFSSVRDNILNPSIVKRLQEIANKSTRNINIKIIMQCFEQNNINYEWFKEHKRNELATILKKSGISHGVCVKVWNAFADVMKSKHECNEVKYLEQRHEMDQQQIQLLGKKNEWLEKENKELIQENSQLRRIVDVAMGGNDSYSSDVSQHKHDNYNTEIELANNDNDEKIMDVEVFDPLNKCHIGSLRLNCEYDSLLRLLYTYYAIYQSGVYCNQLRNSNDCIQTMKEVSFVLWVLYLFMEYQIKHGYDGTGTG